MNRGWWAVTVALFLMAILLLFDGMTYVLRSPPPTLSPYYFGGFIAEDNVTCFLEDSQFMESAPLVALASFPRSGNTRMRMLLEKATGYVTGSIYCDKALLEGGLKGECIIDNTLAVKTHEPLWCPPGIDIGRPAWAGPPYGLTPSRCSGWRGYDRALMVVRNPFDAILSLYHYHLTRDHTKKATFKEVPRFFVENAIRDYHAFHQYWEHVPLPVFYVRYEDVCADALMEIIRWLRVNSTRARVYCALEGGENVYAVDTVHDPLHSLKYFSKESTARIRLQLGYELCRFGYDEFFRDSFNCSEIDWYYRDYQLLLARYKTMHINER